MKIVTRVVAVENLKKYIGKDLAEYALKFGINPYVGDKQNKGWKGLVLERLAGLQTNMSKAPNGLTYELKSVSFYQVRGILVPRETMAITMLNINDTIRDSFFNSHAWAKLKTIIFCAVEWHGKHAKDSKLLSVASLDFAEDDDLIKEIESDYELIRAKLIKEGFDALTGKDGKWIQARTKGTGGIHPKTGVPRPITRAFYAKKELVKKIFEIAS